MAKKLHRQLKVSVFEIVAYSVLGALALWGLTYVVLGLYAHYLPYGNGLEVASDTIKRLFKAGYLGWGLILLGIATVLAIFVLCINAKKNDREVERETRRAARLAQIHKAEQAQAVSDAPATQSPAPEKAN